MIYYKLNWNANDDSWNWKNGTASNVTWDNWWDGGCASFNGSNSYISIPSLSTPENTTMNCWIKTTMSVAWEIIQLCTSTVSLEMYAYWTTQLVLWNNWQTAYVVTGTKTVNDWNWHNVCLTRSWASYIIYVDWELDVAWMSGLSMSYTNNRIGLHTNGSTNPYSWYIDNMILESRTWTEDDVLNYYKWTKGNYWL